jgi:radical SAM superfamily enzyme YgiQ (UPF0313 family)
MRVVLVGADFEENLGVGMVAAAALEAGHEVVVVPFDHVDDLEATAHRTLAQRPDVVGLSIQFQHRADDFLALSRRLRRAGFAGHVTCGGQFPTLAWRDLLADDHGVDSVALHEAERSFVELLAALSAGGDLRAVAGLAVSDETGTPLRTAGRALVDDLDGLPFVHRYRPHARHCGVPFIPLMGGRGCWGACTYCAITSFYRDARAHGGGKTLRHRSPGDIATEMALLAHGAGGSAVFCFHDDNFLMPRPRDSLARVRAIRDGLDGYDLGRIGMIGKCRPDSMTPSLARALRELGVLRLYVGVENASQNGSDHLNRRNQTRCVSEALAACRDAGIFVCYNLLLFEPDATLDDVRENVAFIRDHSRHPVNFCRAEPYCGTPLQRDLRARDNLGGSYLGYTYRIEDARTELLFRVCAAAFRQRNFDPAGVANRSMGLGYSLELIEHFYDDPRGVRPALRRRVNGLTRDIALETAGFLETAIAMVEDGGDDPDLVTRHAARLGLQIATADRERHAELDALYADLEAFGASSALPPPRTMPARLMKAAGRVALSASLAFVTGCDGVDEPEVVDPVPVPVVDPPPPAMMEPLPRDPGPPTMVVDPVPAQMVVEPKPDPEPTMDRDEVRRRRIRRRRFPPPPDPVPPPNDPAPPVVDPLPAPSLKTSWLDGRESAHTAARLPLIDQWRDTTALASRSVDLPMYDPPRIRLEARADGDALVVDVRCDHDALSLRWHAEGELEGEGRTRRWVPSDDEDQITVVARTAGGVAVTSLRARDA